jgi:putative redox protein
MNTVVCQTLDAGEYPQTVQVRTHQFGADVGPSSGSLDSAPSSHDYFDAALASCKALTATWYAKRHGIPLERVEAHVDSDDREERAGIYRFRVRVVFHGPMSDDQRASLYRAIEKCPIHKLMTTAEIVIETVPVENPVPNV